MTTVTRISISVNAVRLNVFMFKLAITVPFDFIVTGTDVVTSPAGNQRSEFCSINAKFLVNRQPVWFWFRPGRLGKEASKMPQRRFQ